MTKYIIEGNIDFYSELYKSLDNNDNNEDTNLCLITDQPLVEYFVQLQCGHKFNYAPLFLDIKNHKQKFNGLEGSSSKLHGDEIRCPYCRNKQKGVLPYYEELGIPKVHGVNYINDHLLNSSSTGKYQYCEFLTENENYDPSGNNPVETGIPNKENCKFIKCLHLGTQINPHNGISELPNYGDHKFYCWHHKKVVVRKYKKEILDAAKQEIKKAKMKEKEETLAAKQKEKAEAKINKQKEKNIIKNVLSINAENVIIGYSEGCCNQILKTGVNKGQPCGVKIFENNMCKRHHTLQSNKNA
jgi:hypothetical protein